MDAKIFNFMVHSMFPMINELYEYRHTANEEMIKLIEEAKNYLNNINRNNINDNVFFTENIVLCRFFLLLYQKISNDGTLKKICDNLVNMNTETDAGYLYICNMSLDLYEIGNRIKDVDLRLANISLNDGKIYITI